MKKKLTPDELFEAAYKAEHGIEQEIDIEEAKELYKKAYDLGEVKAGIFFAKILEKQGNIENAEEIYQEIIKKSETQGKEIQEDNYLVAEEINLNTLLYAKYKSLRIKEAKVFEDDASLDDLEENEKVENQRKIKEQIIDLIKEYDHLFKEMENLVEIRDKNNFLAKVSYHRGVLRLKKVEYYEKLKRKDSYSDKIRRKIYDNALSDIEFAAELDYKKAKAELINIESRAIDLTRKNHKKIITKCNKAIAIDAKNVNAKLLKVKVLLKEDTHEALNKSEAQNLITEILQKEPNQPQAKKIKDKLTSELIKRITDHLIDEIDSNVELNLPSWRFWHNYNIKQNRNAILTEVQNQITNSLHADEFIIQKAKFTDINKIVADLSSNISIGVRDRVAKLILNPDKYHSDKYLENVKKTIDTEISKYGDRNFTDNKHKIPDEKKIFYENRQKFRNRIIEKLMSYHDTCITLTTDDPDFPVKPDIKIDNLWSAAIGGAAKMGVAGVAAFLGPFQGGLVAGLGIPAIEIAQKGLDNYQKQALYSAVKSFAEIGSEGARDREDQRNKAKGKFSYIADEIINTYGMQIDKVSALTTDNKVGLNELANIVVEKMLFRLHETHPSYQQLISKIPKNLLSPGSFLDNIFGGNNKRVENILLDGVFQGRSSKDDKPIELIDETNDGWKVGEIFSSPALTSDGEHIYCSSDSNPKKYGAKFVSYIPSKFKEKKLSAKVSDRIKNEFREHKELLETTQKAKDRKTKLKEQLIRNDSKADDISRNKRITRRKLILSVVTGMVGGLSTIFAGFIGAHPAIIGPVALITGISAVTIAPVAITALVIIGTAIMINSYRKGIKMANKLEKLEQEGFKNKTEVLKLEEITSEMIKEQQMQTRLEKLATKEAKDLKFMVLNDTSSSNQGKKSFRDIVQKKVIEANKGAKESQPTSALHNKRIGRSTGSSLVRH